MVNIVIMLIGIFAVLFSLVMLWYFIRSIGVMGKRSIWLAILALLFSPLPQIVFYFSQKDRLTQDEKQKMKRFFWIILAYLVFVIGAGIVASIPLNN